MKALLYSVKGKPSEMTLPAEFSKEVSDSAMAQAFHVYRERSHTGLPQVQTRGEVSLTTKKMYRQKHTGNARHGSKKAPIFVGGGVTHGPKGVKASHVLSKSLRDSAKSGALSLKAAQKEISFIEVSSIEKTKQAAAILKQIGGRSAVVALTTQNWAHAKAFRNIANVQVMPWESLSVYAVLTSHMLVVDVAAVQKETKAKEVKPAKKAAVEKPKTTKKK